MKQTAKPSRTAEEEARLYHSGVIKMRENRICLVVNNKQPLSWEYKSVGIGPRSPSIIQTIIVKLRPFMDDLRTPSELPPHPSIKAWLRMPDMSQAVLCYHPASSEKETNKPTRPEYTTERINMYCIVLMYV